MVVAAGAVYSDITTALFEIAFESFALLGG